MCARPHQGKFNKHTAPGDTLTDFFSDTGSTPVSSTTCANPNSIFFVKHCFGFVFVLGDVDQSTSFFRRIVSKRLFGIRDASRDRVAPANPRAGHTRPLQRNKKQKAAYLKRDKRLLAGVEGFEPSARGFGDRCSTN